MTGVLVAAGASLYRAAGGGGGGPAFSAAASLATAYETLSGTTASFSPSGENRAIFGSVTGLNGSAPPPSLSDCKYGGSGGTSMGSIVSSSNQSISSGAGITSTYRIAPGPTGATTIYGVLSGASLGTCLGGVAYENVNQTTPGDSDTFNTGSATATTTVASVTITGLTVGDVCIARVSCGYGANDGLDFTAVAGTTIRSQPSGGESKTFVGLCWLEKVAAGTSCTLEVNANQTSSADLNWQAHGMRVVAV
jgi:hypothetical protein